MNDEHRIINEFLELVQVDSVSGKERQIADLLIKKLLELGLKVKEDSAGQKTGGEAGNIIGRLPGTSAGPVLVLCAHMDTVEPGCGVQPVVEDGIIRSSGNTILGADDKAGIVTILEVLRLVRQNNVKHGGIEVAFTIWEEGGLLGAKNLDFNLISAKIGFVLDSNGQPGTIVTRAPSQDHIGAVIRGRAAHAGINPEDGINAIQVAAYAITQMKVGRIDSETTSNIGIISGGKAINIVPESVTIEGEARSLSTEKRLQQTRQMCNAIENAARKYGAVADVVTKTLYPDYWLSVDSLPVKIAVKAARNLGLESHLVNTGGGSDANIFNSKGIATAVLGIGMKKVHTTEEYIKKVDLVNNVRYLFEIIKIAQKITN
ncbi:MAG: M20/M25/M40 family metallo-hydrolase [Desulfotomaculaceae bacterium]|nr:M20/M25/M40 family metallo-hydrolase [Desulfotomaculaceae bacterium]